MDRSAFVDGVRAAVPALPPNVPFGIVFGTTAVVVGLTPIQAVAMSFFTVAGAAQLAAVGLLDEGAAIPVVVLAGLLINLRYVVFSMSLTPHVSHLPRRWRAVIAFPLFDVIYALAAARFQEEDEVGKGRDETGDVDGQDPPPAADSPDSVDPEPESNGGGLTDGPAAGDESYHRGWYYSGIALPLAGSFVLSTLVGALVGQTIGTGLHLDFFIPLLFIALLVPTIDSKETVLAAATAAVLAVGAAGLPFNLGLLVGLVAGTAAGTLADRTTRAEGAT